MKFTKQEQQELEGLRKILTPEQMEAIEEQVENEKAAQRYLEICQKAADQCTS
jgi:hypothetical protein